MIEVVGDIWGFADSAWIVIPISSSVGKAGLIMSAGLPAEAKRRFPGLSQDWGRGANQSMQGGYVADRNRWLIGVKTKREYKHPATERMVAESLCGLVSWVYDEKTNNKKSKRSTIVMPRLGVGLNGLKWDTAYSLIAGFALTIKPTGYEVIVVEVNAE